MTISEILETVKNNSQVYNKSERPMNETSTTVSKTIYSPSYTISPTKGDIYIRFNTKNKSCRVQIFTSERTKFYDVTFGAGDETYTAYYIDINKFIDHLISEKYWSLLRSIDNTAQKYGMIVANNIPTA